MDIWTYMDIYGHKVIRGDFKYYFAGFVRKGGGEVPPKSVTPFLLKTKSVKGGGGEPPKSPTPFSLKTKSVKGGRGVPPKSVTYFFLPKTGVS